MIVTRDISTILGSISCERSCAVTYFAKSDTLGGLEACLIGLNALRFRRLLLPSKPAGTFLVTPEEWRDDVGLSIE